MRIFFLFTFLFSLNIGFAQAPTIELNFQSGVPYLIEGCSGTSEAIVFSIPQVSDEVLSYTVEINGTAERNLDYSIALPALLEFPIGETTLSFPIIPVADALTESTESIEILVIADDLSVSSQTILIKDDLEIEFLGLGDTAYVCSGTANSFLLTTDGPFNMTWEPSDKVQVSQLGNTAIVANPETMLIQVTGSVGTCTDTTFLQLIAGTPSLQIDKTNVDSILCLGETLNLNVNSDFPYDSIVWSPAMNVDNPYAENVTISPTADAIYTVTAYYANCIVSDQIDVLVENYHFPTSIADDSICQGALVKLVTEVPNSPTTYIWTPSDSLSNDSIASPWYNPGEAVSYTLIAVSERGFCTDTLTIDIITKPALLDILEMDTLYLCLDDTLKLNAISLEDTRNINWTSSHSNLFPADTGAMVMSVPEQSTTVIAMQTFENGCVLTDTVYARVDSVPDVMVMADPFPRMQSPMYDCNPIIDTFHYCIDDSVQLFTQPTDTIKFPDMMYYWYGRVENSNSIDTNMTLVDTNIYHDQKIVAQSTKWYVREMRNNGCVEKDSLLVEVIPNISLTSTPNIICYDQIQTISIADPSELTEIKWTTDPENAMQYLDCTTCDGRTSVEVNVPIGGAPSFTVMVEAIKQECCEVSASQIVSINIPPINYMITSNCLGLEGRIDTIGTYTNVTWPQGPIFNLTDTVVAVPINISGIDAAGCYSETNSIIAVQSAPSIVANWVEIFDSLSLSNQAALQLLTNPPVDAEQVVWMENGEASEQTGTSANFDILMTGPNVYKATITSLEGCITELTMTIIGFIDEVPIYIPNAFTPDDIQEINEINRTFIPLIAVDDIPLAPELIDNFQIWNRWGNLVYDNDNNAVGWDGRFDGKKANADVYVYIIEINQEDGGTILFKGDVTLVR